MNIPALMIGVFVSIFVIVRFKQQGLESSTRSYSLLLFTFPFYYFIFAIYGNDYVVIPLEIAGGLLFFAIAAVTLKLNAFYTYSLLAIGYMLHGVYDVTHNIFFTNIGTPNWWPEFCGSIDVILGVYLLYSAFNCRVAHS